jgi:small GTP-binding protein
MPFLIVLDSIDANPAVLTSPMSSPIDIRVVVIGDSAVGKTCMLLVFKGDSYPEDSERRNFANDHENRSYNGREFCLDLWEVADHNPQAYAKCDVVLICFALDSPESLKNVTTNWLVEVKEYCPRAALVLVGTKSDLWDRSAPNAITEDQIHEVTAATRPCKFIPCSAKKKENIGGVFDLAIAAMIQKNPNKCTVA